MTEGFLIGVDIGGTFTDCIVLDGAREIAIGKVPSTPPEFEKAFVDSLRAAAAKLGLDLVGLLARAHGVYHGCTVGTNALVENRTAKVALLTTAGHADSIFFMQGGGRLAGLDPRYVANVVGQGKPEPLIPKRLVEEVDERVAFDGSAVVELNEERCREAIQRLIAEGVESFAVSLLWSIVNPAHEQRVADLVREAAPDAFVSMSSEVVARAGEYERTVATVINALIGPVTARYLGRLEDELAELGYDGRLFIMSCSGGLIDTAHARALPLLTIGSGPVAGLIGAGKLARAMSTGGNGNGGGLNVLTGDMGGTTFDVGVIRSGQAVARATTRHDQYEYFVPTLDIRSIGAGGGSIVHFDPGTSSLRVGPRSAGAVPGPAAYLRGGTLATVTDADLVLGYLNSQNFLGGDLELGLDAARAALARAGEPVGLNAEETAAAAARIVDHQMSDAIRLASVQQGYDPRDQVMYAYGGAGPVHCTAVARELEIPTVVVPLGDFASGWSAFGVATSDVLVVREMPLVLEAPFDPARMNAAWAGLHDRVRAMVEAQGLPDSEVVWERSIDMRYQLQVNDVRVPAPLGSYDATTCAGLIEDFEREYEHLYGEGSGYAAAGFALTSVRVSARGRLSDAALPERTADSDVPEPSPASHRDVIWYERGTTPLATPVYEGDRIGVGASVVGPAIVEFVDTTLVLRDGQSACVDAFGSIVVST